MGDLTRQTYCNIVFVGQGVETAVSAVPFLFLDSPRTRGMRGVSTAILPFRFFLSAGSRHGTPESPTCVLLVFPTFLPPRPPPNVLCVVDSSIASATFVRRPPRQRPPSRPRPYISATCCCFCPLFVSCFVRLSAVFVAVADAAPKGYHGGRAADSGECLLFVEEQRVVDFLPFWFCPA